MGVITNFKEFSILFRRVSEFCGILPMYVEIGCSPTSALGFWPGGKNGTTVINGPKS